jgi:hypothetical protein
MSNSEQTKAGFVGQPESELEVAYLLGLAQEHLPFPFIVTAINDAFPDCEGIDPTNGKRITIELEVYSRSFLAHGHPLKLADGSAGCDYIVCWEDNWPDSPVPVVSLRTLFETVPALRHRLVYQPRPESLRGQLLALRTGQPASYEAVTHFLDVMLPELQRRIPAVVIGDAGTKHFVVKYGSGKGLLGVYPSGKLVCAGVDDTVRTYGQDVAEPTVLLRQATARVGVIRSKRDGAPVLDALESLIRVIQQVDASPSETA